MNKFMQYTRYLYFIVFGTILVACGGRDNFPSSLFNGIRVILENGSIVAIPVSSLDVAPGGTTSTSITLTGGTPGITVNFTSSVSENQSTKDNQALVESIPIQVIITPDSLVTGPTSSAAMIVKVLDTLSPGTYYIKLF